MNRSDSNIDHFPVMGFWRRSPRPKIDWKTGKTVIFLILLMLLIHPSETTALETDRELEVKCVWDYDLFVLYGDHGVSISETEISPRITITNNLDVLIKITSVAVHMDWQAEGENYYSWIYDIGFAGQEVPSGEDLIVEDVWIHLDPNRIGTHEYRVLVGYFIGSEKDAKTFITSDRSVLNVEFNKLDFIASFVKESSVIYLAVPVILLGLALHGVQHDKYDAARTKIDLKERDGKEMNKQ